MSAINFPIIVVRKFSTNAVVLSPALTSDNLPLLPDYDWASGRCDVAFRAPSIESLQPRRWCVFGVPDGRGIRRSRADEELRQDEDTSSAGQTVSRVYVFAAAGCQ